MQPFGTIFLMWHRNVFMQSGSCITISANYSEATVPVFIFRLIFGFQITFITIMQPCDAIMQLKSVLFVRIGYSYLS
jgi:hypothetical protein